jgi:hypothetical protein
MADLAGAHGHAEILLIGPEDLRVARILKMSDRVSSSLALAIFA